MSKRKGQRFCVLPGDWADDLRGTLVHERVMKQLGRRTDQYGWCIINQGKLAAALGVGRQAVNAAIGDLVDWGYIEKKGQAETKRNVCFYRVIIDREDAKAGPRRRSPQDGGVSPVDDTWVEDVPDGDVSSTGDTYVSSPRRHQCRLSGDTKENPPINNDTPPLAPQGGDQWETCDREGDEAGTGGSRNTALIAALHEDGKDLAVTEALLAPVLAAKRCRLGKREVALGELRSLRTRARAIPAPALKVAAARLIARDGPLQAFHIRDAIDAAKDFGQMVPVKLGMPQFAAWAAYFEAGGDTRQAQVMRKVGTWLVRAEWPPSASSDAADKGAAA